MIFAKCRKNASIRALQEHVEEHVEEKGKEHDAQYYLDLKAGRNLALVKRKEASRRRAATRRERDEARMPTLPERERISYPDPRADLEQPGELGDQDRSSAGRRNHESVSTELEGVASEGIPNPFGIPGAMTGAAQPFSGSSSSGSAGSSESCLTGHLFDKALSKGVEQPSSALSRWTDQAVKQSLAIKRWSHIVYFYNGHRMIRFWEDIKAAKYIISISSPDRPKRRELLPHSPTSDGDTTDRPQDPIVREIPFRPRRTLTVAAEAAAVFAEIGQSSQMDKSPAEEEIEDLDTPDRDGGDELPTVDHRSWVKPAALRLKSVERKRKDQRAKKEKETKSWEESGLRWCDWVAGRRQERKKRQAQVFDLTAGDSTGDEALNPWKTMTASPTWYWGPASESTQPGSEAWAARDWWTASEQWYHYPCDAHEDGNFSDKEAVRTAACSKEAFEPTEGRSRQKPTSSWYGEGHDTSTPRSVDGSGRTSWWCSREWTDEEWHEWELKGGNPQFWIHGGGSLSELSRSQHQKESQHTSLQGWYNWLEEGRERIDIVVDSGASTSMLPKDVAKDQPMRPGTSRSYMTASQHEVRVEGEKEFVCGLMNGSEMRTTWEVGDINRPLSSVSQMVRNGYRIWFDTEERGGSGCYSYATDTTTKIYERDGIFVLPAWIRGGASSSSTASGSHVPYDSRQSIIDRSQTGFGRQGRCP